MFNKDLTDLSDAQRWRLQNDGCRPVVDCEGNAIGVARTPSGAARVTLMMAHDKWTAAELEEVQAAVVEYDGCYVIGTPQTENYPCS